MNARQVAKSAVDSTFSFDMQFSHTAEVEAIDGKCDRQREEPRTMQQGPEEEPPILDAFDAADTELVNGAPKSQEILWVPMNSDSLRPIHRTAALVLTQKYQDALVIKLGRIELV